MAVPGVDFDEKAVIESLGMKYHNIPSSTRNPKEENIAEFLNKCGEENNDYYVQSIRIASRAALLSERDLSSEEMKLLYPQGFSASVENWCKTYNVEPAVMYALIRSESFFDLDIKSHAGRINSAHACHCKRYFPPRKKA